MVNRRFVAAGTNWCYELVHNAVIPMLSLDPGLHPSEISVDHLQLVNNF